jgi:hypothetical protein
MNPGAWKFTFDLATRSLHHNNEKAEHRPAASQQPQTHKTV